MKSKKDSKSVFYVCYPFNRLVGSVPLLEHFVGNTTVTNRFTCHMGTWGWQRSGQSRETCICKVCEMCVYFHYLHFHLFLCAFFFFLSVMSNIHALLPAVTFCTQSSFLTQFVLLPTLSGFVPYDLFLLVVLYFSFAVFYPLPLLLFQRYLVFLDCHNALCSSTRRRHVLARFCLQFL